MDTVSEVTARVPESVDTHVSQTTFIMKEMVEVLKLENHGICTGEVENGRHVTEETAVIDLIPQAQEMLKVLEMIESKSLGKVTLNVKLICVLLGPSRKTCSKEGCINDKRTMRAIAEEVEHLIEVVLPESETPEITLVSSLSLAPVSGKRDVVSQEPSAKRPHKPSSLQEERCLERRR